MALILAPGALQRVACQPRGAAPRPCPCTRAGLRRFIAYANDPETTTSSSSSAPSTSTNTPATPEGSAAPPSSSAAPLLSKDLQANAYGALAAGSVLFGAVAVLLPEQLLQLAAGITAGALDVAFTRIAGSTMAISAAAEFSLQDAVVKGHLGSATYQRMMLGVIAKSSLYLLAFALSPEVWTPQMLALFPTTALASVALNGATLAQCLSSSSSGSSAGAQLWELVKVGPAKTTVGWVYTVFVLLYLATVAACYVPEAIFLGSVSPVGNLLKHIWGPGFLLSAVVCYIQKDAADRGRLGASTFMKLNIGLAALELGYSLVLGTCLTSGLAVADASGWSNLAGSIGIAGFCLVQFLTVFGAWITP